MEPLIHRNNKSSKTNVLIAISTIDNYRNSFLNYRWFQ